MRRRCYSGAELVVNVSSSPFRVGVVSTRREMLATRSSDNQATLVYANTVGAQDGLVFDGGGHGRSSPLTFEPERGKVSMNFCPTQAAARFLDQVPRAVSRPGEISGSDDDATDRP